MPRIKELMEMSPYEVGQTVNRELLIRMLSEEQMGLMADGCKHFNLNAKELIDVVYFKNETDPDIKLLCIKNILLKCPNSHNSMFFEYVYKIFDIYIDNPHMINLHIFNIMKIITKSDVANPINIDFLKKCGYMKGNSYSAILDLVIENHLITLEQLKYVISSDRYKSWVDDWVNSDVEREDLIVYNEVIQRQYHKFVLLGKYNR